MHSKALGHMLFQNLACIQLHLVWVLFLVKPLASGFINQLHLVWAHILVKPTSLDFTYNYKILYMYQGPYEILMNIMQSSHITGTISTFERVLIGFYLQMKNLVQLFTYINLTGLELYMGGHDCGIGLLGQSPISLFVSAVKCL